MTPYIATSPPPSLWPWRGKTASRVESGRPTGSLAYAYPTYEGSGPKTDLPTAERDNIRAINEESVRDQQVADQRVALRSQTLLLHACPLAGPIPRLTAWTMTRVQVTAGYSPLGLGLGILLALMLGMSAMLTWLTLVWSHRVRGIENALVHGDGGTIPILAHTGEQELDRIIDALNEAATRLVTARREIFEPLPLGSLCRSALLHWVGWPLELLMRFAPDCGDAPACRERPRGR